MKRVLLMLAVAFVCLGATVRQQEEVLWTGPKAVVCVYGPMYVDSIAKTYRAEIKLEVPARVMQRDGVIAIVCPDDPSFLGVITQPAPQEIPQKRTWR